MRLPRIYFCFIWIQIVSNYICASGLTNEGYLQTSQMGWWEARDGCIEHGTDFFVPSDKILHSKKVKPKTYYWVGGFETSQWRWTDNSPLFTLIGQYTIPNDDDVDVEYIPGNSVLECYRECDEKRIGLSGSQCYCLEGFDLGGNNEDTVNKGNCPGNPEEECGTNSSMSVYEIDINFEVGSDGDYQCGYALETFSEDIVVKPWSCGWTTNAICVDRGNQEPNCIDGSARRFNRCIEDLCVTCDTKTWSPTNQTCALAKVSKPRETDFVELLYKYKNFNRKWYWVGLHKSITRYWINGNEVQYKFLSIGGPDPGPRCLAIWIYYNKWTAHWIPCNAHHQSLCRRAHNTSGDADISSEGHNSNMFTETTIATTIAHGPELSMSSQTTVQTITRFSTDKGGNESTAGRVEGNDIIPERSNGSIGIIVGVVIGAVIIAILIFAVIVLKRKGKFCFQKPESKGHTIAIDNIAYMSPNSLHNNDVIHGTGQRGESTTSQRRPGNDDKKLTSEEGDDYDTTNVKRNVDTGNHYNHLGADEDNYDTAGVNRIGNVQNNTYNNTGNNHVAKVDNGQFRTTGQDSETYNHLGVGSGVGKSTREADQCYNHLVTDVDNDYDTTRPVVDNVQDDTYNHTGSGSESRGNDSEVKLSTKDGSSENSSDYYNM